jgi:hypothetical protein
MNKLILDGVEYKLSDELVAKLKESVTEQNLNSAKKNPFERSYNTEYYYIGYRGHVVDSVDNEYPNEDLVPYSNANYCRDEAMMKQRALHETLNRLLWRYSETHGGDTSWETTDNFHYFICWGVVSGLIATFSVGAKAHGVVYFKDKETARAAIEEVVKPFLKEHPEFVW